MIFPVVMYGCESWTIKKAEYQRTDAFKLWCWRRLLRVLNCKEIKPVNPKGNQPFYFDQNINIKTLCLFCFCYASPMSFDIIFQLTLKSHFKIPLFFPLSWFGCFILCILKTISLKLYHFMLGSI